LTIDERFTLGLHTLKIQYNGTERYSETHCETFLSVISPVQIIVETPESVSIGSNVEVGITISDLLGRVIPGSVISINDITSNQRFTTLSSTTEITTNFEYELQGPSGIHILEIKITENVFITNTTSSITFSAWSTPDITLLNCNVEYYAFPGQEILFEIRMFDWAGNCSSKTLLILIDDELYSSKTTDEYGLVTLSISVPYTEGQYNISMFYSGNSTLYESSTRFDYDLHVTSLMPVRLELDSYEVMTPSHKLSVHLTLRGLNGSTLHGVKVNFDWLESSFDAESTEGGMISLNLKVPATSGNYVLSYESETTLSVISTSGSFLIKITMSDIMSLQGVGITGLTIALIASVGISTIPIIRRRYLVG
jgi:hypothetical protein